MINSISEFESLDDLLYNSYKSILEKGSPVKSKRGKNIELTNFGAKLNNPRVRTSMSLDRKLVKSKFAEFAWYVSKNESLDYIRPYISLYNNEEKENDKILGAYGPKIFGNNDSEPSQFERVVEQIKLRSSTKQAYIALSDRADYRVRKEKYYSPPCTVGLHFVVRDGRLNLTAYMRSNDAYFGLPHDLFCFTMIQELVSCRTNLPLGSYTHIATSMHIYEEHLERVNSYLSEGYQESVQMPKINNCSWTNLNFVGNFFDAGADLIADDQIDDYWKDFVLFSNRIKVKNDYLNKFKSPSMRTIASNSLSK